MSCTATCGKKTRKQGHCGLTFDEHRTLGIRGLMHHILEAHHAFLRRVIPELSTSLRSQGCEIAAEIFDDLSVELLEHMGLEEWAIFLPSYWALDGVPLLPEQIETCLAALDAANADHSKVATVLRQLSDISWNLPGTCGFILRNFEHDLYNHILEEEQLLFPALRELHSA